MALTIETYYRILELPLNASSEDIRVRYHQLARVYHPDRYTDAADKEFVEAMMKRVNEAYNALRRTPQPQIKQTPPPPPPPAVYRTVKGVPTVMACVLTGVAFVLGTIVVQLLNVTPLSSGLFNPTQSALLLNSSQSDSTQCISPTMASEVNAIPLDKQALQPAQNEALEVKVSGIGLFPVRPNAVTSAQALDVEPIAEVLPTDTPTSLPTATSTVVMIPTATPMPPVSSEPPAVALAAVKSTTTESTTSAPTGIVHTDAGVLYTITNPYSVYARTIPSIQSEAATLLVNGQQVLITGRTGDNYWLRVKLNDGGQAWVYAESAGANSALLSELPIVNP